VNIAKANFSNCPFGISEALVNIAKANFSALPVSSRNYTSVALTFLTVLHMRVHRGTVDTQPHILSLLLPSSSIVGLIHPQGNES
jgi:hypothetical protein